MQIVTILNEKRRQRHEMAKLKFGKSTTNKITNFQNYHHLPRYEVTSIFRTNLLTKYLERVKEVLFKKQKVENFGEFKLFHSIAE